MGTKRASASVEHRNIHLVSDAEGPPAPPTDYFVEQDGIKCAGIHLLLDLWDAVGLSDRDHVERALRAAVAAAKATLLHLHIHQFSSTGGLSGVAVLAESHISIHTWPERDYAAIDLFMCGGCNPYDAVPALRRAFCPGSIQLNEAKRGIVP